MAQKASAPHDESEYLLEVEAISPTRSLPSRTTVGILAGLGCGLIATGVAPLRHSNRSRKGQLRSVAEKVLIEPMLRKELVDEQPWECHLYRNGQDDAWCQEGRTQFGYEYNWVGWGSQLCGDGCSCCKKKIVVQDAPPKASSEQAEASVAAWKARNDSQQEASCSWQCHDYVGGQHDEWCRTIGFKGDFRYRFVGEGSSLCGSCWCCKQPVVKPPPISEAAAVSQQIRPWQCHHYIGEQDDDWCQSAGKQNGTRYSWVGDDCNLCGPCWCCKQALSDNVTLIPEHRSASPDHEVQASRENESTRTPWKCHAYAAGQDDSWCQSVGTEAGWKYQFVGEKGGLCEDCLCCKQELATMAILPTILAADGAQAGAAHAEQRLLDGAKEEEPRGCAGQGQDCQYSHCCEEEGFQCYRQSNVTGRAFCKSTCTEVGWDCTPLGRRSWSTVPIAGAGPGEKCAVLGRCRQPGFQCYLQDDYNSACKATCGSADWACTAVGKRAPLGSHGGTSCAWGGHICAPLGCCIGEGLQCYEKDEYESACLSSCRSDMDFGNGSEHWSCKTIGERHETELGCSWATEECTATKRCCHEGSQCVAKDALRAYCTPNATTPGWNGTILGAAISPQAISPVPDGSEEPVSGTVLFCFMVVMPEEDRLLQAALGKGTSVFGCDAHKIETGWRSLAADTDRFSNVWLKVLEDGTYEGYDWTVKVAPDAIFFPDRLRSKLQDLRAPSGSRVFLLSSEVGPMDALEVLSKAAMQRYARYFRQCYASTGLAPSEDSAMARCFQMIGIGAMQMDGLLHVPDGPCADISAVAFHALKTEIAWDACFDESVAAKANSGSDPWSMFNR